MANLNTSSTLSEGRVFKVQATIATKIDTKINIGYGTIISRHISCTSFAPKKNKFSGGFFLGSTLIFAVFKNIILSYSRIRSIAPNLNILGIINDYSQLCGLARFRYINCNFTILEIGTVAVNGKIFGQFRCSVRLRKKIGVSHQTTLNAFLHIEYSCTIVNRGQYISGVLNISIFFVSDNSCGFACASTRDSIVCFAGERFRSHAGRISICIRHSGDRQHDGQQEEGQRQAKELFHKTLPLSFWGFPSLFPAGESCPRVNDSCLPANMKSPIWGMPVMLF